MRVRWALRVSGVMLFVAVASLSPSSAVDYLGGSTSPPSPNVPERNSGPEKPNSVPGQIDAPAENPNAAAARAVLYEEDPTEPNGRRLVGTVRWRAERIFATAGQVPEMAVIADIEIPERRLKMSVAMRRNSEKALPASHVIDVKFDVPPDFPGGPIGNVPGILAKGAEAARGMALSGISMKMTPGVFMVGLSAVENDLVRNTALLKERSWFDIPVVYGNGQRAILTVEKGTTGERIFQEAFRANTL
jgi:hypothetical protein